ncbi:MAG TPA: histidinol dehydrogenase [Woeseiaceae bacterium]|nr:histidinol dehydrogenase [Woeseiaceae bacterium]
MDLAIRRWESLDTHEQEALLARPVLRDAEERRAEVRRIIEQVRRDGDAALVELTARYDGVELDSLRVSEAELAAAEQALAPAALAAIDVAIANVRRFHAAQAAGDYATVTFPGIRCERVSHPIDAVGLYVPAGSAPLPSTAIMLAVPAALAGCPRRIMCTPPRRDGRADPAVLVAAVRAGVSEIYKAGGAHAIAAMAYGTETLPKVDRIFGPGSAWVTAAKTEVAADPAAATIDMAAGPSELLVIADANANPAFVAADLLSQAEHGADSQVLLVTPDETLALAVLSELKRQLPGLERRETAAAALEHARVLVVRDLETAAAISNRYAPEHLSVQTADPRALLPALRNAGSVFLGPWSPETAGDYASGTNHVLPTYGQARSVSGLGVDRFRRQMTVQELSEDGLRAIAGTLLELAALEGLDAHAQAVRRRLARPPCAEEAP